MYGDIKALGDGDLQGTMTGAQRPPAITGAL
ncbi:protein of unknown function [Burkholderia multivorans]